MTPRLGRRVVATLAGIACVAAVAATAATAQADDQSAGRAPAAPATDKAGAGRAASGQPPAVSPNAAALQEMLDAVTAAGVPSALAYVRDASGEWAGASGKRVLSQKAAARPSDRFRIGSASKPFTAVTILQLAAEGRLSVNDPVEKYLPGLVPGGANLPLRNLLQMTSGLANYSDLLFPDNSVEKLKANRFRTFTPRELVALSTAQGPDFAPGERYEYSNTNYILLGLVVEAVTGQRAEREIDRRIIRPLRLRNTSFPDRRDPAVAGPHVNGYLATVTPGVADLDYTVENVSWAWTAGAMISTTEDIAAFWRGLLGGRLLPAAQLATMLDNSAGYDYGLGVQIYDTPCGTFYGHNGDIPGYSVKPFTSSDGATQVVLEQSLFPISDAQAETVNAFAGAICDPSTSGSAPAVVEPSASGSAAA